MDTESIDITIFPGYPESLLQGNQKTKIAVYLQRLLQNYRISEKHAIQLPSLTELASFFHSTPLKIHDVLQVLRSRGYDYQLYSLDDPIPFWSHSSISRLNSKNGTNGNSYS